MWATSGFLVAVVRNDVVPFVGGRAGNKGDDGFGLAHVEDFVGHAGFDVNEIAGFVLQHFLASVPEFVADFSFNDVKDHFEVDMDVGIGDAARRNGGDVGREFGRADVFSGHALFIMNPIPITTGAAAANGQYAIVIF